MAKKFINEERLFELLPNFFETPENAIYELLQNSQRAGAKNIEITFNDNGNLTIFDDGVGLINFENLFILSKSGWDNNILENQQPAGWGIFSLFAICNKVTFKSIFGTLDIDCKSFFESLKYRESLFRIVKNDFFKNGFFISAKVKNENIGKINSFFNNNIKDKIGLYKMNVKYNGQKIENYTLKDIAYQHSNTCYIINKTFKNNPIYIKLLFNVKSSVAISYFFNFYGQLIKNFNPARYCNIEVYYDIYNGLPVTPVLPYRHSIKQDVLFEELDNFIKKEIEELCIEKINNADISKEQLLFFMKTLKDINLSAIEKVNKFYYVKEQPYFSDSYSRRIEETIIYTKNDIVNFPEIGFIYINKNNEEKLLDKYYVNINENAYWEIKSNFFPKWTKIKKEKYIVKIKEIETVYQGNCTWVKCFIDTSLKINVLSSIENFYGSIFFKEKIDDFSDIQDSAFLRFYNEEWGSLEEEKYAFDNLISEDIQNMKKEYDKNIILASLGKIDGLDIKLLKKIEIIEDKLRFWLNNSKTYTEISIS